LTNNCSYFNLKDKELLYAIIKSKDLKLLFLRNPIGNFRDLVAGEDKSPSLFLFCTLTVIVSSLSPYTM